MSRNIEVHVEYEPLAGKGFTSVLHIHKKRGKLTLDEIVEACRSWEWDCYAVLIKATGEDEIQYDEDTSGDFVRAVSMDHVSFR